MATWKLAQGTADSRTVPIVDGDGNPVAFTGLESLSATIWPGGNRATLITLAPTWLDPTAGLTTVAISGEESATLDAAIYRIQCTVDLGIGSPSAYYRGSLQILASPGADTEPPSYCSDDDLRDHASWIDSLDAESDQTGFGRQRGLARQWLDGVLVSRWKVSSGLLLGDPGYGAFAYGAGYSGTSDSPSKWLKDQLAADKLIVTDQVKELCAKRALYLICRSQIGCDGDHPYQDLARSFRFASEEQLKTYRAEIDLEGSGYASIVINCGATSLR